MRRFLLCMLACSWGGALVHAAADDPTQAGRWQWLFHDAEEDLQQWTPDVLPHKPGPKGAWLVRDGELTVEPNSGILWTKETFSNFILELEVKVSAKGNSGVLFRAKREDPVQGGMEIQILDDHGYSEYELGSHAMGSLYGCVVPGKRVSKPAGQWQTMRIVAQDNMISVTLNGHSIVEADLNLWTEAGRNPDGSENKFKTAYKEMPRTGYIGLQDHGTPMWFRNIRVKRLE